MKVNIEIEFEPLFARRLLSMHYNVALKRLEKFTDEEILQRCIFEGYGITSLNGISSKEIQTYFNEKL